MPRDPTYRTKYGYEFKRDYDEGYEDGYEDAMRRFSTVKQGRPTRRRRPQKPKKKRTLSKWQKFMKSPKSQIKIKRGKDKGKLNLKAMGRAYRKKQKGKK